MKTLTLLDNALLSKSVLKTLTHNNITTILDFLQLDAEKLATLTKLNLSQILEIRNDIFKKYSAPLLDGPSLYAKSVTKKQFISTGMKSLDAVLGGGIPVGYITELYGLAGSGKTQLCFHLAANCVRYTENVVLYIDTKGDFSAVRIQKILHGLGCSHQDMARALYKIKIVHICSMEEIIELFRKMKNKIITIDNLVLIIIDSLPCLMFQHFGDENKIGLTFLNIFVNHCRFLGKNYEIAIICINIQTRWVEQDITDCEDEEEHVETKELSYIEKQNRCLGKYWQHIPALVLLLEKIKLEEHPNRNKNSLSVKATLIRSNGPKLGHCVFNTDNSGVR